MKFFDLKYALAQNLSSFVKQKKIYGHRILMYHSIFGKNKNLYHFDDLHTVNEFQFKDQIDYLYKLNIVKLNIKNISLKNSISITFDDGFFDNYIIVYPWLRKKRIPWTFFVVTDFLKPQMKSFINKEHLIEMSKSRYINIGSHSKTHTRLTNLSKKQILHELEYSKKYLEDILGKKVNSFSYPHGSANSNIAEQVKNAGYEYAVCSYPYYNDFNSNYFLLNRQAIIKNDTVHRFSNKINGKFDWTRIRFQDPKNTNNN